jgi:hypothetical protein
MTWIQLFENRSVLNGAPSIPEETLCETICYLLWGECSIATYMACVQRGGCNYHELVLPDVYSEGRI